MEQIRRNNPHDTPIVIVAAKTDLRNEKNPDHVSSVEARRKFEDFSYIETSAKKNKGVEEAFSTLTQQMITQRIANEEKRGESKLRQKQENFKEIKPLIETLDNYIDNRLSNPHDYFKGRFLSTLFGGFSKEEKIAAVDALKSVLKGDAKPDTLESHPALKQGQLGEIYKQIEPILLQRQEKEEQHTSSSH